MKHTLWISAFVLPGFVLGATAAPAGPLAKEFVTPPDAARPGVYWYFMDGNFNGPEMLKDLDSMKEAGLGNALILEVDAGVPRGPVKFMSEEWQNLVTRTMHHAERLGMDITLGAGPGWCGSGGPWVKPEQSMQHLVFSTVDTKGPAKFDGVLPMPAQRIDAWHNMANPFYQDVVVYAFPKCNPVIGEIDEKALYGRNPFSSMPGVKAYLPAPASFPEPDKSNVIDPVKLIDLTSRVRADGKLAWDVPAGEWTIMRMGRRSTGANTRPAPAAGTGLEHDKFDAAALDEHFANYCGKLLAKLGPRAKQHGWTAVHLDSWEMGAQNWTPKFREEFRKRRGYDPQPYFVTFSGRAVKSVAESERFLWDMRLTTQELIVENYAGHLKELGRKNGLELSIEPYDMNPTADLELGAVADVPMCEFWSAGMGFDTSFSCIEASFCMGVNRFVFATFAHESLGDEYRPGMTMGPYGMHWDRGQTWWPLVKDYHRYVTRCSHLLRQGVTVSDVLYLTPEGAPHVFRPPPSALNGSGALADKKGYGFDGCSPNALMARAEMKDGRIVFPGGSSYRLLVLSRTATMTPKLLEKITQLVEAGAVVYGSAPAASPSLSGYPQCDAKVRELADKLWGKPNSVARQLGKGRIIPDPAVQFRKEKEDADAPLLPNVGSWIWFNEGNPAATAAAGDVHFRYTWEIPDLALVKKARIEATADNTFTLKINDKLVLSGDDFHNIYSADVLSALRPGKNTITVLANNLGPDANPAGFIAALRLGKADGSQEVIGSDQRWSASRNTTDWSAAKPLGPANMAPWHLSRSAAPAADLYPAYATTAAVLEEMNVPQDFQSDGPVRYAHRETADLDIYFISNTTSSKVKSTCTFRVEKGTPQLWDPVTAEIRALPQFTRQGKATSLPVTLEPHQGFFVIFPRGGPSIVAAETKGANFSEPTPVATLDGSWDVAFDPKWGGPEKVTFKSLQDWTTREERGIKYYSGIATYRKAFDLPKEASAGSRESGKRIYLDLGTVHDMARVRLNGKDLGVVWCAPWRSEMTGAVKDKGNLLEIAVANRWSNRMLGDQQPPDKDVRTVKWPSGLLGGQEFRTGRYTFATAGGLGALLPSGLLGPVRITAQGPTADAGPATKQSATDPESIDLRDAGGQ
ncbi:MAG: glycosyl hydrolase [Kiritimatiellaeota bacterium]|nr:glycosyl hydrolase [Kiritimatiellota bacterium]